MQSPAFWSGYCLSERWTSVELAESLFNFTGSCLRIFCHKVQQIITVPLCLFSSHYACRTMFRLPGSRVCRRNCRNSTASPKSRESFHDFDIVVWRWWRDMHKDIKWEGRRFWEAAHYCVCKNWKSMKYIKIFIQNNRRGLRLKAGMSIPSKAVICNLWASEP